jgi:hypothetical protein
VKSLRLLGQVLALCLPASIAVVPAVQASPPAQMPTAPTGSVSIWHGEVGRFRQSADTPMVVQVRSLVERAMRLQGPALDLHRRAYLALSARYGSRLLESSATAAGYVWMWNPVLERWVMVCLSSSTLVVDFGRSGTVVVRIEQEMPVD